MSYLCGPQCATLAACCPVHVGGVLRQNQAITPWHATAQQAHSLMQASATRAAARVANLNATTPCRLLLNTYIVEDSPLIRENLIATLEELAPVRVVGSAEDESTALRWLADPSHPVDLVIVDIFLKSGSGLGVLRAAQAMPQRYRLVVLSNYATSDMRRNCLALGAERVFDKSHEIDALIQYCSQREAGDCPQTNPAVPA
jgi:CheY-like chemotaxis protein